MRVRMQMNGETAEMSMKRSNLRIYNTKRMQGIYPASSTPINAIKETNQINEINSKNAIESEVRTVMGGLRRRNYIFGFSILNLQSFVRMALMAVLTVVILGIIGTIGNLAEAVPTTYYLVANNADCGSNLDPTTGPYIATVNMADGGGLITTQSTCTTRTRIRTAAATGNFLEFARFVSGPVVGDKIVTGSTNAADNIFTAKLKNTATYNIRYVLYEDDCNGNPTGVGGTDTASAAVTGNNTLTDWTLAFTGTSITVRNGFCIGIQVWMDDLNRDEFFPQHSDPTRGETYNSQVVLDVVDACSDPDPATISITQPASNSTVSGIYTIQVQVTGEANPDQMQNMAVTVTGSSACDVANQPMVWNAGTGLWEYNWDTTACGTGVPEGGITITVNGNDPDCNDPVSTTNNNITIDNTCPATAPSDLQATNVTYNQVDLQWTADCTNNDVYRVYRDGTNISGDLACSAGTMNYSDTTVTPATSYTYTVRGYNTANACESTDSNQVNVTTPDTKTTVTGSSATPGDGVINVSAPYSDDANANNYVIISYSLAGAGTWTTACDFTGNHQASPYTCQITGLTNGTAYDVKIDWFDADGVNGTNPEIIQNVTPQAPPLIHNSDNTGSSKWSAQGGWGIAGGKYGAFTCGTCHTPRATNIKGVRSTITTPDPSKGTLPGDGQPIVFTKVSGNPGDPGVMGDDSDAPRTSSNRICEICHTYDATRQNGTAYHAYNQGADPGHNNATDCMACHPHNQGFKASGDCYSCHQVEQGSRRDVAGAAGDFVKLSHHVTDGTTNEIVTQEACMVCHGDIVTDKGHPGANNPADPDVWVLDQDTGTYLQFYGAAGNVEQFCVSCHDAGGSTLNGAQPFNTATGGADTNSPPDIGWTVGAMAHSASNGNAGECMACHGNSGAAGGTLDPAKNAHGSDSTFLLQYAYTAGSSQTFCYNCHGTGGLSTKDVQSAFGLTYNHATGGEDCEACHNPHKAEPGLHTPGAGGIGGVNKGVAVVDADGNGQIDQYDICFQCHNAAINKTNLTSEQDMDNNFAGGGNIYQTNWNTIPDIQSQFATTNYAYHPLFAVGRNQPQPNVNTYDANNKLIDPWANVTNPKYLKQGASGLDNNFVDGWGTQSLVTCTDCHDNDSGTGARGPHGSAQPWILKGIDQTVTVTTAGAGTIQPNADADTTKSYIAANFCVNCHRADVYGWGANLVPTINGGTQINNEDFSRLKHLGGAMRRQCASTDVETGKGGYRNIGCLNCHGGGEVGGIHGSNLGVGNAGQAGKDEMGKRFMNGNSWSGHILADQTGQIGCYTGDPPAIGVNMSGCSGQHSGGKNVNPTYYYQWQ